MLNDPDGNALTETNNSQTKRHREISRIAFAGDCIPKYGPAILIPQYCGKWIVSTNFFGANMTLIITSGA